MNCMNKKKRGPEVEVDIESGEPSGTAGPRQLVKTGKACKHRWLIAPQLFIKYVARDVTVRKGGGEIVREKVKSLSWCLTNM